ncbi:hypothetical protein [Saliphagus infecundisoli]|uniref:DUF8130 domain-containing protein n=1 Tax=Saliphagus infecundisoli TaxID=1849069 RepID=A0ABD5QCT3_9EURY|nr:hypothetical protein [Saliphagus infecundisoli]
MKRRTFVAAVGSGLGPTVAGCLGNGPGPGRDPADDDGNRSDGNRTGDPGDRTDGTRTRESEDSPEGNDSDGTEGDDPDGDADGSGYAVALEDDPVETVGEFATLRVELVDPHVEPGSPAALKATLTNETEGTLAVSSGAPWPFGVLWAESEDGGESITLWNDAYEESEYVGTDGKRVEDVEDIGVGEEIGAGESITRAFEIHEDTPGLEPGSYETSITVGIGPRDDSEDRESLESELVLTIGDGDRENNRTDDPDDTGNGDDSDPRIDDPSYEIEEPEPPDDPAEDDDWNEHYLGEEMPAEPTLEFEALDGARLETFALSIEDDEGDQYALDLIESREGFEERFDLGAMDPEDRERVQAVDFDEQVVVVAESGFGSGSVRHRWKRVEENEGGVHLHGYYTQPYIRTDDYGPRLSVLVVERPDGDFDLARASLTVSPDRRVHFDSTEGVVTVDSK